MACIVFQRVIFRILLLRALSQLHCLNSLLLMSSSNVSFKEFVLKSPRASPLSKTDSRWVTRLKCLGRFKMSARIRHRLSFES